MKIIEHPESFEVRDADDKPVRFFYFDDNPGRRAFSGRMTRKQAEQEAKAFAGSERQKRG
jgi:hypothetical protein